MSLRTRSTPPASRLGPCLLEQLEGRVLLDGAPLPTLADLENPNHPVIRVETSLGDIDIELLRTDAPGSVANVLERLAAGKLDETFFHFLSQTRGADGTRVLQGLTFARSGETGAHGASGTDGEGNESSTLSNIERTVALSNTLDADGGMLGAFTFNLADNSAQLDGIPGRPVVFGRVATDASWAVLQAIAALQTADLNFDDTFDFGLPGNEFGSVPVTSAFQPGVTPVPDDALVQITDIELIKPADVQTFYNHKVYYPEGFAGSTINEFLPIANPNDVAVTYQVILRHENGIELGYANSRDKVVATGTIAPNSRGGVTIFSFADPDLYFLVEQGRPYAFEIHSTLPVAATLSHYDFGTSTGEGFTSETSTTWAFAQAVKGGDNRDFLVWQNANMADANLAITFYFENRLPEVFNVTTAGHRRGGLSLGELPLVSDGPFAVRIVSDVPIVAALSHYNQVEGRGSTTVGVPGEASIFGVLPLVLTGSSADHTLTVLNTGGQVAIIDLRLSFNDPNRQDVLIPARLTVSPNSRASLDLSDLQQITENESVSVSFRSNTPVYAQSTQHSFSDDLSDPAAVAAAPGFLFGEGFMDPARAGTDVIEFLTVFNPNSSAFDAPAVNAVVTVNFIYTDGFVVSKTFELGANRRLTLNLHELPEILDQGRNNARFFYSTEVSSTAPIVAEMWHYDLTLGGASPSGGFSTLGTPVGQLTRLDALGGIQG